MIRKKPLKEDLMPEGVYGITSPEAPTRGRRSKAPTPTPKVRSSSTTSKSRVKPPVSRSKSKSRGEPPTTFTAKSVRKTSKRSSRAAPPKPILLRGGRESFIPGLDIRYDQLEMPSAAKDLPLTNAVALSDELLTFVKNKTELRTRNLANLILRSSIPSMLACDAGLAYTKTFLEAGFGFETIPDQTIPDSLADLVRFEALIYFVRVSSLPKLTKRKLIDLLTRRFADQIAETLKESLHKKKVDDKVRDMEAFVLRTRSDNKVVTSQREDPEGGRTSPRGSLKRRGAR